MDRILVEIGGGILVGGGSYAMTKILHVSPLDKSWSSAQNTFYFCAIPMALYLAFRIYLGLLFFATSSLSKTRPYAVRGLTTVALTLAVAGMLQYVPHTKQSIVQTYEETLGDVVSTVLTAGEGQLKAAQQMGFRIFGLLVGWFVLLFAVELVLRVFLWMVAVAIRTLASKGQKQKPSTTASAIEGSGPAKKREGKTTSFVEDEHEDAGGSNKDFSRTSSYHSSAAFHTSSRDQQKEQ